MIHISELARQQTRRWIRNISDDPQSGLKRKVEVVKLSFGDKAIELECEVFFCDDSYNKLSGSRYSPYKVTITAGTGLDFNTSPVIDSTTGLRIYPDAEGWYDNPNAIFRFDAIMAMCGITGIVDNYVYMFIDAADVNLEYNI